MSLESGSMCGPYEVVSPLGSGGMGEVYRARDRRLGREIAIKVLREEYAADGERLRRFEQEARAASALNHPQIVTIYDIGESEGTRFIAMELVRGRTVRELLRAGPLAPSEVLDLALQTADLAEKMAPSTDLWPGLRRRIEAERRFESRSMPRWGLASCKKRGTET